MLPTSYRGKDDGEDGKKRRNVNLSLLSHLPLPLRRIVQDPSLLLSQQNKPRLIGGVFVILILFLIFKPTNDPRIPKPLPKQGHEPTNWGDYVAMGLAREKMLEQSPKGYADLGDRYLGGAGSLYQKRDFIGGEAEAKKVKGKQATSLSGGKDTQFDKDRRGILGGSSTQWSSGIVGSGAWLGSSVDMMKDSLRSSSDDSESPISSGIAALADQIYTKGWVYLDEEDELNTKKLLAKAKAEGTMETLPLRDQVRGDDKKMKEAAMNWAKIYASMEGESVKSALEIALEKMVRRVPIVVFSKTTCPHSQRAKELLQKYHLSPAPHIIEVDLRPDGVTLKGLLTRRTGHSTFPNIIIGSRSIGGADDLDALVRDEEGFKAILEEVGVTVHAKL